MDLWRILTTGILMLIGSSYCAAQKDLFHLSKNDLTLLVGDLDVFDIELRQRLNETAFVNFYSVHGDVVQIRPDKIRVQEPGKYNSTITGVNAGLTFVIYNVSGDSTRYSNSSDFIRVVVQHSYAISLLSVVVGWVYFFAWSVSFYPQIYSNFRRKSVVGLNFDFLALNIFGFLMYTIFNIGLFFIPSIEREYFSRNPQGLNPVQINDVVFSMHAVAATLITIVQCLIYERGHQRISTTGSSLIGIFLVLVIVSSSLAGSELIHWLDFLYHCSYIKLAITLIKYVPQAYMNYKRKSTEGWSIGNIFLDFTGGMLSMLQMILNAYNYDDWVSIFGDPTKFGLGLFSVVFDIFFIIQHYVLYR